MPTRLVVIPTSDRHAAESLARPHVSAWMGSRDSVVTVSLPSPVLPFIHPWPIPAGDHPLIVWLADLPDATGNVQQGGTRLVTTQTLFLLESVHAAVGARDALCLVTGDRARLAADAPPLLARRGRFAGVEVAGASGESEAASWTPPPAEQVPRQAADLAAAFRLADSAARLAACVEALDGGRSPAALVATASACMEVNDLDAAARDLDEAIDRAPEWAAAHFERGKLWLRRDDLARASEDFQAAADRLPGFGSAWANLGATLGELDRPMEALAAFQTALACDPGSHQAVNNVGVVQRELGQLAASEASFRRVVSLAPDLAFGYYNLGHTLFLQGRYQAALHAYVDGQRRDGDRNPVQAARLAMCRLASGDAAGAVEELRRATDHLPREYRRQLLDDTQAIAWALLTDRPDLAGWRLVNDWLTTARQRA
jgi:tetratricopeptide (TPR) repeat protein